VTGAVVAGAGAGGATAWVGGVVAVVVGVVAAVVVGEDGAAGTPWSERTRAPALAADRAGVRAGRR
jgi:hypothetical protein